MLTYLFVDHYCTVRNYIFCFLKRIILKKTINTLGILIALLCYVFWFSSGMADSTKSEGFLDRGFEAYHIGNYKLAKSEWVSLAESGDPIAQFNLAVLYDSGKLGNVDKKGAIRWYLRAANQGLPAAQFNLASAYISARGVDKRLTEGLFWLLIASQGEQGEVIRLASEALARVNLLLSLKEQKKARRKALEWRPKREKSQENIIEHKRSNYLFASKGEVTEIQKRLKKLGYDPGKIDGIPGPLTQDALRTFLGSQNVLWQHGPMTNYLLRLLER